MERRDEGPRWPEGISEAHERPSASWGRHASPLSLIVFGSVLALGLAGVLGHERDWHAESNGVELLVHAPEIIRNGEFLEVRIEVESDEPIEELVVGLTAGLLEDITVNTMIPAPAEEQSADGEFRFTFAELEAGTRFLLKVDAQVNPDIVGGNEGVVAVYDGERRLVETTIAMSVLP
jgi:hypothetical protein